MSFEAMAWAIKQECGSAPSKLVLLMLANHSNGHTGQCNPRMKLLAAECEMRPETLRNHVKTLEERGFITVLPQYTEGVQLPNQYRLNFQGCGGEIHGGGMGDFRGGGGGDFRRGGGGEIRPPYNQEVNQESKQERETPPLTPQGDEPRKRSAPPVMPDGVDQQVWSDWIALRKAKRAPVTQTVIDGAMGEAAKAGMTFEDFLRVWCRRGTQGLEAAWLKPDERKATATRSQPQPKSFAQQEREAGWARWEQQTNRQHPDRLAYEARNGGGIVIDMQTATSQQSRISQ